MSAASLSDGRALSVPNSQHSKAPSSRPQLISQEALLQPLDISLPQILDPCAPQMSQHERVPAGLITDSDRQPDDKPSYRPSSGDEPDVATRLGETALGDSPTPSRHSQAAVPHKDSGLAPSSSLSEDDANVRLPPDAQQQQLLSPSKPPMLPMRPQEVPQPLASDAVGEDVPGKPAIMAQYLSSPCESPPAPPMLYLRQVPQQVAVLENRIAETGGHIPSPSKTGDRSFQLAAELK